MIITKLVEINKWIQLVLYLVPYLIIGYDILKKALKGIFKGQSLMKISLWLVATVGAVALGEFSEGCGSNAFHTKSASFSKVLLSEKAEKI